MAHWELISREDNPEEWARMEEQLKKVRKKVKECEMRGHGQLLVDADGYVVCRDCEDCVLPGPDDPDDADDPDD